MNDAAQVITALATLIASVGTVVIGLLNMRQRRADTMQTNAKIDAVHHSTNGLAERNEAIARKLGVEEGKREEKGRPS